MNSFAILVCETYHKSSKSKMLLNNSFMRTQYLGINLSQQQLISHHFLMTKAKFLSKHLQLLLAFLFCVIPPKFQQFSHFSSLKFTIHLFQAFRFFFSKPNLISPLLPRAVSLEFTRKVLEVTISK